jgi:flagella basal body P-ring formation protein FlgA
MLKKALSIFVIGLFGVSSIIAHSVATDEVTLRETMSLELLEWLYVTEGVDASAVTMDTLDRRIRVPECLSGFEFNFPFSDRRTVRVSCREPVWSIVTRVNFTPLAGDQRAQSRQSAGVEQEIVVYELTVAKRSGDILSGTDIRAVTTTSARRTLLRGVTRSQIIGAKLARDMPAGSMLQATDILRAHRVITASSAVPRGATLNETNTSETIVYGNPPADTVRSLAELSRMVVTTQLRPGQPVRFSNLRQQPDVIRGDEVILTVRRGPVTIETTATALEQGVTGEQIRVQSPDSGETFRVLITGVRRVEAAGNN